MNIIDIVLLVCLIPAVIQGLRKGFIAQVTAIISLVLGGWLAYRFSSSVTAWATQWTQAPATAVKVLAFILIFAVVVTVLYLLGKVVEASVKIILLGWLNRLLGLIFALLKYVLVIGLIIVAFEAINNNFNFISRDYLDSSLMYTGIRRTAYAVFPYLKQMFF